MNFTYLLVDFFTVVVPVIFSFHPKLRFDKFFKSFFKANIIVACVFITWDIYFTRIGIWGFNSQYLTGLYIFNLPIEEILFFICIPFACVFTYHCLNLFFEIKWSVQTEKIFILTLSTILFLTGIYFINNYYTSTTFISLAILLITLKYFVRISWLRKLICIYPILLFPFFIVNGFLTGSGLEHPIVWYNNEENLGIRLLTIPIEDIFYGFELILLNVFLYEYFIKNSSLKKIPGIN
jgi:lycopene cyclase domain-containing protein